MTPELIELAKRLVAATGLEVPALMDNAMWDHGRGRCFEDGTCWVKVDDTNGPEAWVPDLTDDATGGALLGLLGAGWTVRTCRDSAGIEYVSLRRQARMSPTFAGPALAAACASALLEDHT